MTAPERDEWRERLDEALSNAPITDRQASWVLDALAPVVRELADQRAAEELRAAADIPLKACCPEHASKRLRARAAVLAPTEPTSEGTR